ncbi:hypothetical protein ACH492_26525 [Streptomyces sp. NPDC019443]|uniref:hypothetical protein n=1 Tax=Streptomyces sp. NPDC019443 TaxID=3365061 RepID=UPI0037A351FC
MADSTWLQPVITGVATLSGATLGALATYLTQRGVWRRQYAARWDESRRVIFSRQLSIANSWHDSIEKGDNERADALLDETYQLSGEVSLLASDSTRTAASELFDHLANLHDHAFINKGPQHPDAAEGYLQAREAFREAARLEMGVL